MTRKYNAGDQVRICNAPNFNCKFGWNDEMSELCGRDATIKSVYFSDTWNTYVYRLDIDDQEWMWDEACLNEASEEDLEEDLEESCMDILFLLS